MPVGAGLAVAGVGTVVGGIVQSRASNNATRAQMRANDQALAYQRETDTYERGIEERKYQDYQQRRAEWLARRPGGPAGGAAGASAPENMHPVAVAARSHVMGGQPGAAGAGGTPLAELIGAQGDVSAAPAGVAPAAMPPPGQEGSSLADLARWSDHNQYFQA